ncbi:hypothetical protein SPI_03047 [Niveomyces insectorum RCEF 264]|uniref:Myb-like DNA-binding domain-containing protein n=1 Tax=Niveomyces insectorum RCEF 264 TaxID=1081102 RepID=A0A162MN51_9HYPO|nr:hypothetical protein SPI_03047 [Niveomyces insectorum RCEF 264]
MGPKSHAGSAGNGTTAPATAGSNSGSTANKAMARLLYAVLKQKSLKDIDWNKVARDPVLLEEISNGHAARMRYARFRAAVENPKNNTARIAGRGYGVPTAGSTTTAAATTTTTTPGTAKCAAKNTNRAPSSSSSATLKFKVTKPKRDTKKTQHHALRIKQEEAGNEEKTDEEEEAVEMGRGHGYGGDGGEHDGVQDRADPGPDHGNSGTVAAAGPSTLGPLSGDSDKLTARTASVPTTTTTRTRKRLPGAPLRARTANPPPAVAALPRDPSSTPSPLLPQTGFPPLAALSLFATASYPSVHLGGGGGGGGEDALSAAVMMRHHSAGSGVADRIQQPAVRTSRMLTPCSDVDHLQHEQPQQQPPTTRETTTATNTFDFAMATASTAAAAAAHYARQQDAHNCRNGNTGSGHGQGSPPKDVTHGLPGWLATPFSSPQLGVPLHNFELLPYALGAPDGMAGFVAGSGSEFGTLAGSPSPELPAGPAGFPQNQQQRLQHHQQQQLLAVSGQSMPHQPPPANLLTHALLKHASGWNTMIGQGNGYEHHDDGSAPGDEGGCRGGTDAGSHLVRHHHHSL